MTLRELPIVLEAIDASSSMLLELRAAVETPQQHRVAEETQSCRPFPCHHQGSKGRNPLFKVPWPTVSHFTVQHLHLLAKIDIRLLGSDDSEQGIHFAVLMLASQVFRNSSDSRQRCNQFSGLFSWKFVRCCWGGMVFTWHFLGGFSANSGYAITQCVPKVSSFSNVVHIQHSSICDERRLVSECRLEGCLLAFSQCSPPQDVLSGSSLSVQSPAILAFSGSSCFYNAWVCPISSLVQWHEDSLFRQLAALLPNTSACFTQCQTVLEHI